MKVLLIILSALVSVPIVAFWAYILFASLEGLANRLKVNRFIANTKANLRV